MRTILLTTLLITLLAGSAIGTSADPEAVLAEWNDGSITVREYVTWWKQIPAGERDTLTTMEAKAIFLGNMINAELTLAEAESLDVQKDPAMQEILRLRRFSLISDALLERAMEGAAAADEEEVEETYREQFTQVGVRRIMVDTFDEVNAIVDSLAAGVPFEDLAFRYSTDVTGERGGYLGIFRRAELEEPWATKVMAVEAGEISEPFFTQRGWAIVKVETRTELEPQDPDATRAGIRRRIEQRHMFDEQAAYLDSLSAAYGVEIYLDAVIGMSAGYALALMGRDERTTVVAEDIVPDFTEEERNTALAAFGEWKFTYEDCARTILSQPYVVRPVLDDPDDMIQFVGRQVKDTLLVAEGENLGVGEWPDVALEIEKVRRRRHANAVFRVLTADTRVPEDVVLARYEEYRDGYRMPAGYKASKIVVLYQSTADSIMVLLDEGESFETLARKLSVDPFTAPGGGYMGFFAEGKDSEFDGYVEIMEPGETRYFRSLEGHLILRLHERLEERAASLDDARPTIEKGLIDGYKELEFEAWLEAERGLRGMRTYDERLEPISLVP